MVKETCVRLGIDLPKPSFLARGIHFAIVVGPPPSVYFAQKDFAFVMAGPVVHPGRRSHYGLLSEHRKSEQKSEEAEGNRSHSHGRILKQFLGSRNAARHRAAVSELHRTPGKKVWRKQNFFE